MSRNSARGDKSRPLRSREIPVALRLLPDLNSTGRDETDEFCLSPRLRFFEYVLQVCARRGQADPKLVGGRLQPRAACDRHGDGNLGWGQPIKIAQLILRDR